MTDATTGATFAAPRIRHSDAFTQRGRKALIVLFALIAVAGVAGGIFIATNAGDSSGTGLSLLFALIPLPLLWFVYWWLDRYEPEPRRYKFAAFVWGGVVAVAIALVLETWIQHQWDVGDEKMAALVAPLVEEPAKCLFLLLTFVRARRAIDGFVDGLVFAGIVGIGFAFVENIGYYAASYLGSPDITFAGAEGATATFVVRGVFSPFAHPLFTSAFGIALGFAVTRRSKVARFALGVVGLAVSIFLHFLWNGSLVLGGGLGFIAAYLTLAAVLVGLGIIAAVVRGRQMRILEQSLAYVAKRGWIHPDEIPYLSHFGYRRAARNYAKKNFGKAAADVVDEYQKLATEMAFLHHSILSGRTKPQGVERTYAMLDDMYALRPELRLPPALRRIRRY